MSQGDPNPLPADPRADRPASQGQACPAATPLTPEHHAQLAQAKQRRKKIRRAGHVAAFHAYSFSVFAGLSLLFAVFSLTSLIAAFLLAGLAWNEFRGRRHLKQFDPRGPRTLGINQTIFSALIALYCGLQIYNTLTGPGVYAQAMEQSPEIASMLEPMQDLLQTLTLVTYAIILIVGVTAQGLTAWYYFSRQRWLNAYLKETPRWILDLDRA